MPRFFLLASALLALPLAACGPSNGGNDGGSDGGCDGPAETPPNLIHNPGFECGGAAPAEWSAVYGTLDFPTGSAHSGQRHARITADSSGAARFSYSPNVVMGAGNATLCARAWVKGTPPYMRLRLMMVSAGGGINNDFSSPVTADWARVPPTINLNAPNMNADRVLLVFEAQTGRADGMNSKPGDTLEVDDVDVWQTTGSACSER